MKKYNLMRGFVLATALGLTNPIASFASTGSESKKETNWGKKAEEIGKSIVDWSEKADEKITEKVLDPVQKELDELEIFKHESLCLITTYPNKDPNEEKNYFFIDLKSPYLKWTYYYDKNGNKISSQDPNISLSETRQMYLSVTNSEVVFRSEQWMDYENYVFTVNYIELDKYDLYDSNTKCSYGKFSYIEDIIPQDRIKEKYSKKDLIEILDIINSKEYIIEPKESLSLQKKQ